MTFLPTLDRMREKDFLKNWLLLKFDLLKVTGYHQKLPSDSPKLMPLDSTLNKDVDDSGRRHVAVTRHLRWDEFLKDRRKFSFATPKEGNELY